MKHTLNKKRKPFKNEAEVEQTGESDFEKEGEQNAGAKTMDDFISKILGKDKIISLMR